MIEPDQTVSDFVKHPNNYLALPDRTILNGLTVTEANQAEDC